ncbi:hypothetical protein CC80DRAFT_534855 [Byssothecium circinans]|uniref:Uncharacterized protein n=1 Tax=Byssothecium circinans TaxID=147558 RepID=A0A6A5U1D8_9PLEO|nr:hypothetical protein CC80DRAFT_534855 [Byssothecium circinans]
MPTTPIRLAAGDTNFGELASQKAPKSLRLPFDGIPYETITESDEVELNSKRGILGEIDEQPVKLYVGYMTVDDAEVYMVLIEVENKGNLNGPQVQLYCRTEDGELRIVGQVEALKRVNFREELEPLSRLSAAHMSALLKYLFLKNGPVFSCEVTFEHRFPRRLASAVEAFNTVFETLNGPAAPDNGSSKEQVGEEATGELDEALAGNGAADEGKNAANSGLTEEDAEGEEVSNEENANPGRPIPTNRSLRSRNSPSVTPHGPNVHAPVALSQPPRAQPPSIRPIMATTSIWQAMNLLVDADVNIRRGKTQLEELQAQRREEEENMTEQNLAKLAREEEAAEQRVSEALEKKQEVLDAMSPEHRALYRLGREHGKADA